MSQYYLNMFFHHSEIIRGRSRGQLKGHKEKNGIFVQLTLEGYLRHRSVEKATRSLVSIQIQPRDKEHVVGSHEKHEVLQRDKHRVGRKLTPRDTSPAVGYQ